MNQSTAECFAEEIKKIRATYIQAEILDSNNRPLATGEASLMDEGAFPVFHLQNDLKEKDADNLIRTASVLRRSDGTIQKILRCDRCEAASHARHFHLQTQD